MKYKKMCLLAISFSISLGLAAKQCGLAQSEDFAARRGLDDSGEYEKDTLLLISNEKSSKKDVLKLLDKLGAKLEKEINCPPGLQVLRVRTPEGKLATSKQSLENSRLFSAVQVNQTLQAQGAVLNVVDPYYPMQWQHGALHSPQAWTLGGGKTEPIAIVDCGFENPTDSELNLAGSFGEAVATPPNKEDHGQLMALLAAARQNGKQGVGIAPGAKLFDVPVLAAYSSALKPDDQKLIEGIAYCTEKGIRIVCLSLNDKAGPLLSSQGNHEAVKKVFQQYHDKFGGIIVNAAAASGAADHSEKSNYAIVVCGLNKDDTVHDFNRSTAFAAPAQDVCAGEKTMAGTSCACALSAGVLSLIWGANPQLKNTQVEEILLKTARRIQVTHNGEEAVCRVPNAEEAVKEALDLAEHKH